MRVLLYTGKGGVGKTTTAAATALCAAASGQRTLLLSADASHSLSDVLGRRVGPKAVEIAPNLEWQEGVGSSVRAGVAKLEELSPTASAARVMGRTRFRSPTPCDGSLNLHVALIKHQVLFGKNFYALR